MCEAVFIRQLLQDAATTGNGTAVQLGGEARHVTMYVAGAGTISGGVVTIEEARTSDYTGTWSALTTVTASGLSGGKVEAVHLTGAYLALRARISTDISGGGSVTVEIAGN